MKFTHLVVGLGNPEGKYFSTWHNVGFVAAERLAQKFDAQFKKKGNQMLAGVKLSMGGPPGRTPHAQNGGLSTANVVVGVLKPLTYMNLSGQAVVAVSRKHKIPPENIIVIYDDVYIEKGHIRVSFGGSGGGHNGIRSINELLKTNQYLKIRIGVKPEKDVCMKKYVLTKIPKPEQPTIDTAIDTAVDACIGALSGVVLDRLQSMYNQRNKADGDV